MDKRIGNLFKGDKVIWMVFFFLCMISIIEVFSASSNLTYKSNSFFMPMLKHSGMLLVGFIVAVVTMNVPCRYFKLATPFLILISFGLLVWVIIGGESINGANRVIQIGSTTFQPSEIAKGTTILCVAQILSAMQTDEGTEKNAFKYIIIVTLLMAIPIMLENLSTAALLCLVVFLMMIIGQVPWRQLGKLVGVVLLGLVMIYAFVMLVGKDTDKEHPELSKTEKIQKDQEDKEDKGFIAKMFHRADTWKARIDKFSDDKEVSPKDFDLRNNTQVAYANIAIVSSNIIGRGPGNSEERDFLPQAYSDFIFAIIIEEMGLLGASFVVFLYIVLLFRTARIARRCENNFPAFLAMGLALLLVVQATFNMMVAVGFVPVTGQPLPLISRGGTSTIINCAYIGAILSVSRTAKVNPDIAPEDKTDQATA